MLKYVALLAAAVAALLLASACGGGEPTDVPGKDTIAFIRFDGEEEYELPHLFVVNADGSGLKRLAKFDGGRDWSPDGTRIAFALRQNGSSDIFVIGADGSAKTNLTDSDGYEVGPRWSPDGGRLAYVTDGGIHVMNADGSGRTMLGASGRYQAWSPDGSRIAFVVEDNQVSDIYVMRSDGSQQMQITDLDMLLLHELAPAWSPDGRNIAFTFCRYDPRPEYIPACEIYVVGADGSGLRNLTASPADDLGPAWSPDGARIAFTSITDGRRSVFTMNADGSDPRRVADGGDPAWSPDGMRIAFDAPPEYTIYTMRADGSDLVRITAGLSPVWSPVP